MIMGVDHITHRYREFFFDESPHSQGFIRNSQGIDHDGPLWAGDYPCGNLSVNFTLEPVNVFRYAFALHGIVPEQDNG
jgi:hypothetical protein